MIAWSSVEELSRVVLEYRPVSLVDIHRASMKLNSTMGARQQNVDSKWGIVFVKYKGQKR